mmetsp:Transcript_3247/g.4436  ORF Transcript_3247/g.4436 Transcript_3247/m.4436 type:complete len:537 (+) Transcript_3247:120-1730(+)
MMVGIHWPVDPVTGKVSTTKTGKKVWIAALRPLAKEQEGGGRKDGFNSEELQQRAQMLIQKIESMPDKNWRHGYSSIVYEISVLMGYASGDVALSMARSGIDELYNLMDFGNESGCSISTSVVEGKGSMEYKRFRMGAPRGKNGEIPSQLYLSGQLMKDQLNSWASYGCIERDTAEHVSQICDIEDVSSLVEGKVFVLLGATSELGPYRSLAEMGATIACVARKGQKMKNLIDEARTLPCTLLLPVKSTNLPEHVEEGISDEGESGVANIAGADLITDSKEIADWVSSLYPDRRLVIVSLAYLDGEKHVRASLGMDLICKTVCERRRDTALAFIVSPATAHAISEDAYVDRLSRLSSTPFWHKALTFSGLALQPQMSWTLFKEPPKLHILNGLANLQGPNYALAKTFQQWRAMVARTDGYLVSANHGPSTRTVSMTAHSQVSHALEGMQVFEPLIAFDTLPAKTLMTCLLLWDLSRVESKANADVSLDHPMELFIENSVHGGIWRCPYSMDSIGALSFLIGKLFLNHGMSPEKSLA